MEIEPECGIPEAWHQVHEGGLAAAVGADDGDGFAVGDVEVDASEDGVSAVVGEVDLVEADSLDLAAEADGVGLVDDFGLAVHEGADAVGSGACSLDFGVDVRELSDRVGDADEHGVEGEQVFDRHGPGRRAGAGTGRGRGTGCA